MLRSLGIWIVTFGMALSAAHALSEESLLPWEVWKDPGIVSRVPGGVRTVVSSSRCPGDCEFDRHSAKEPKFIRTLNDEGVIFETKGSGAITRIWMTQGDGVSHDLDESIHIRITIDGSDEPVVDLPVRVFFTGQTPPFLMPMVLDHRRSGGGNVSVVPIGFHKGCRVSLVGTGKAKIWYQVTAVLVDERHSVASFSSDIDLDEWRRMLQDPGVDPWPQRPWPTVSGSQRLSPGEVQRLAAIEGPDQVTGLILRVPKKRWPDVELRMEFDGKQTVAMPLTWFFGVSGPKCLPMRSLFIGGEENDLYSYFPMPFFERAVVEVSLSAGATAPVRFEYAVRWAGREPAPEDGIFHAEVIDLVTPSPKNPARLLDLAGRGRLAGLAVTMGLSQGKRWAFLEGDETVVVDGEKEPSWRGTGVEDFFGGGFYFRNEGDKQPQPFRRALHGFTCTVGKKKWPSMSLYRLLVTDGPFFNRSIQFLVEGGPNGDLPVRWRGVYWVYLNPSVVDEGSE